ncbi:PREDICTED: uncharacterized protein LOC107328053 isoform X1 [Acropora digitifera]|uniref:uncharacterized protein LOC107328053 isoform X1 n=1 Tax=Acropora digitifera TaxID=70779 RepID=UPI00077B1C16|nr:PREDICTED: uncharacterized protein LOC107328053 isoform X1 [Acropora digitifera]
MASTSSTDDLGSQIPSILAREVVDKAKVDGFQQTIELLQIDAEELSDEISHSVEENESLSPEELGPHAYVAGYLIQSLYQKSKKFKDADSPRNHEIQVLLLSIKVPTEENQYISSLSREGLRAPNSWLVQIAEITELCFQRQTKLSKPTSLPVDKVVEDVLLPH